MEDKNMNILIRNESSKEELIHNNVVANLDLSLEEEVEYLRYRVVELEQEAKFNIHYALMFLITFLILCLGIALVVYETYLLGILFIIFAFVSMTAKLIIDFKGIIRSMENKNFEKINKFKKILEDKLK